MNTTISTFVSNSGTIAYVSELDSGRRASVCVSPTASHTDHSICTDSGIIGYEQTCTQFRSSGWVMIRRENTPTAEPENTIKNEDEAIRQEVYRKLIDVGLTEEAALRITTVLIEATDELEGLNDE